MHGLSDHVTYAKDVLTPEFKDSAVRLGLEYFIGTPPTDNVQRIFNSVTDYAINVQDRRPPAWVVLMAMSVAYARSIGESLPESWWIAAAGQLPIDCHGFAKLVRKAARELDCLNPPTMPL